MNIIYPILYMLLIFLFSSIPDDQNFINSRLLISPSINNGLHIPAYGLLVVLWFLAFHKRLKAKNKSLLYASVTAFTYGIFDELHQLFIPGRLVSLSDIFLNSIGIGLATLIINIIRTPQTSGTR